MTQSADEEQRSGAQRILVVNPFLPLYDHYSGYLRLFRLLQILRADGHHITFLARNGRNQQRYVAELESMGIEVFATDAERLRDLGVELEFPNLNLARILREGQFDTAIIEFHAIAQQYLPLIRRYCPNTRIVIDTVDLHFIREARAEALTGKAPGNKAVNKATDKNLSRSKQQELAIYNQADELIVISDIERDALVQELPNAVVHVIPNVHDIASAPHPLHGRHGLFFVGNFSHPPNAEGILWFCREVLPRVHEVFPTMTVYIAGENPPDELVRMAGLNIQVLGWIPSLDVFLNSALLSIAPLLHGAGMKGKVGEAMAAGLPVVTTSIGAEGIGIRHKEHAMVADDAENFAAAVIDIARSPALWQSLSEGGRAHISRHYTTNVIRAAVRTVIPPPFDTAITFFGIPDWNNENALANVIDVYVRRYAGSTMSSLCLGVLAGSHDLNIAANTLVELLTRLGHNPEHIPDISLIVATSDGIADLRPETVWVPMDVSVPKPVQLRSVETFANLARL